MLLSMLVLIGYPYFMAKFSPQPAPVPESTETYSSAPAPAETVSAAAVSPDLRAPDAGMAPARTPTYFDYENEHYTIRFSNLGGTIVHLEERGKIGPQAHQTVLFEQKPGPDGTVRPGAFGVRLAHEPADLMNTLFELRTPAPGSNRIEYVYEKPGEYRMVKTFVIHRKTPVIDTLVTLTNLSAYDKHFPIEFSYRMDYDPNAKYDLHFVEAITGGEKIQTAKWDKVEKKGFFSSKPVAWAGFAKKYYIVAVKPEWKIIAAEARAQAGTPTLNGLLRMEPVTLGAGETQSRKFLVYAGPQHYQSLKATGAGFEDYFSRGFLGVFKLWLMLALNFLNGFVHNYGWAIILLTVLIKILFAPVTHISFESQRKMQAIQPKMKALQERYKGNNEKLHKETMELFKRNRVNPMAGCLPMLIQMPVLIAMYHLLSEAIELQGAPFIGWIQDLSAPDRLFMLPFTVPFLGWDAVNLLPLLMVASQFGFQKIMPQASSSPEQAMIFNLMPVIFGFICYNMPSGLVLYWSLQNLLSILHHMFVSRVPVILHHDDKD